MSLTLFPLKFMCAVSFVFALFLSVCYWDYGLGIMVWGLFFFALGWECITVWRKFRIRRLHTVASVGSYENGGFVLRRVGRQ